VSSPALVMHGSGVVTMFATFASAVRVTRHSEKARVGEAPRLWKFKDRYVALTAISQNAVFWEFLEYALDPAWSALERRVSHTCTFLTLLS
jgi:hypothetical protein